MSPPLAARNALEYAALPWLQAAVVASMLPHAWHLPLWLTLVVGSVLAWSMAIGVKKQALPPRWLLVIGVLAICAGIVSEYRGLFGREPGVALLVAMATLKLLELRTRRDASVLLTLSGFLLLTHFFHSQSIPTALWLLFAVWLIVAAMLRLQTNVLPPTELLRQAARLGLQSLPLAFALFLLFPRIAGPLWGLPQDAPRARTGLSERVAPGSISDLAQSSEIAFRVRFNGPPPHPSQRYWRGPVLETFDGTAWLPGPERLETPQIEALSPPLHYETTLEASQQRWLLALDAPQAWPDGARLTPSLSLVHREPLRERARFTFASSLDYRHNETPRAGELQRNLRLPANSNPRSQALGREWREALPDPMDRVRQALQRFAQAPFAYTLQPPLLGPQAIDDFLFQSRRGFCEHYAVAFVLLMRAAGVPARVVTGYQGGEINPVDGYLVVRQSDAHAWAEVWLAGQGWLRIDPTAAVAPERIERGLVAALPEGEPLPLLAGLRSDWLLALRNRWEAINNAWNQQVLGFNPERQRAWLSRLGLADPDWRQWAILLASVLGSLLAGLAAWLLWPRRPPDPWLREWQKALRHLARQQVDSAPGEAPLALLARVQQEAPALAGRFQRVVDVYLRARYGPPATPAARQLQELRAAVAQLSKGNPS